MYGFTIEKIESRVLAQCNQDRLKEHRQCEYCHLIFDCTVYREHMKKTLCNFLDEQLKEGK